MFNKFITYYFKNLKILFLIIIISVIISLTVDKTSYKSKNFVYEISNIPILKLNKIIPNDKLLELITPGKIRVSQEGVIDQPSRSAMELISNTIFEHLIDGIQEYDYKNNFLKENPQILGVKITSNNMDWAKISFSLDINENVNQEKLIFNFMEKTNLETKELLVNLIKNSDQINNIDYYFTLNKIELNNEKSISLFYIFIITFLILNYFYYLIFSFRSSKLKLKI